MSDLALRLSALIEPPDDHDDDGTAVSLPGSSSLCALNTQSPLTLDACHQLFPLLLAHDPWVDGDNVVGLHLTVQAVLCFTADSEHASRDLDERLLHGLDLSKLDKPTPSSTKLSLAGAALHPTWLSLDVDDTVHQLECVAAQVTGLVSELSTELAAVRHEWMAGAQAVRQLVADRQASLSAFGGEPLDRLNRSASTWCASQSACMSGAVEDWDLALLARAAASAEAGLDLAGGGGLRGEGTGTVPVAWPPDASSDSAMASSALGGPRAVARFADYVRTVQAYRQCAISDSGELELVEHCRDRLLRLCELVVSRYW